jgi:hypothetical protein
MRLPSEKLKPFALIFDGECRPVLGPERDTGARRVKCSIVFHCRYSIAQMAVPSLRCVVM